VEDNVRLKFCSARVQQQDAHERSSCVHHGCHSEVS
jgi:hypothetical protein